MGRTLKQWALGGPENESMVDMANRMTKEFVSFHTKQMNTDKNPDNKGLMSLRDIEEKRGTRIPVRCRRIYEIKELKKEIELLREKLALLESIGRLQDKINEFTFPYAFSPVPFHLSTNQSSLSVY